MVSERENRPEWGKTFQERFWWWRNNAVELTLEQVQEAVNEHLEPDRQLARSTLSNYEAKGDSDAERRRASEPRASFLAALAQAFPKDLNVDWLVTGEGHPKPGYEDAKGEAPAVGEPVFRASEGVAMVAGGKVYGVFLESLYRLQGSLQDGGDLSLDQQAELAEALADLVLLPRNRLSMPGGQRPGPSHDDSVDYILAMLTAVMQATPPRRKGWTFDEAIARLKGQED